MEREEEREEEESALVRESLLKKVLFEVDLMSAWLEGGVGEIGVCRERREEGEKEEEEAEEMAELRASSIGLNLEGSKEEACLRLWKGVENNFD